MLATAYTGKNRKRLCKNAGEWTGRVEISERKKSLAVSEACHVIGLTFVITYFLPGRSVLLAPE